MVDIKTQMVFERETKNQVLYLAESENAKVQNLYVRKSSFTTEPPRKIEVVIHEIATE